MVSPQVPPGLLVSVTDARATLSRIIAAVQADGEHAKPVFIGRHGEPMAVLLSLEHFHEYCALAALRRRQMGLPPLRLLQPYPLPEPGSPRFEAQQRALRQQQQRPPQPPL